MKSQKTKYYTTVQTQTAYTSEILHLDLNNPCPKVY